MPNNHTFSQDSMSLEVDDRFYQSQSSSKNFLLEEPLYSNYQQKEGISQFMVLSQNTEKINPQTNNNLERITNLNENNSSLQNKRSSKQLQKYRIIHKERRQERIGRGKITSQKKKYNSKNYRERKKQSMQKLQQQYQYYKNRSFQLQQKVRLLETQIGQLKYDHENNYKSGYEKQYSEDLQFLKNSLSEDKAPTPQVIKLAMRLREKYGPAGHDRKMILNYYMSQYINSTMGDFQKYIFSSALKKSGPFGESKSKLDDKINDILSLNQNQKHSLRTKVLPELYPLAVSYSNCCKNIYKDYVNLLQQANKFHNTMSNGLNYIIVPQLTKLVVWFEENKSIQDVRRLKEEWIRIFSGQLQPSIYSQ